MEWSIDVLQRKANSYNRIYFNNEIKLPIVIKWSKQLYNAKSDTNAHEKTVDDVHYITFNINMQSVSEEIMRNTLVHEMIHAWQDEYDPHVNDDFKNLAGHGPSFVKKCEELNKKFKFRYPLMRYTSGNKLKSLERSSNGMFFVYKDTYYIDDKTGEKVYFPIGVFVKMLYGNEINSLRRRGFKVNYYKNPVFSEHVAMGGFEHKPVESSQSDIKYSFIKNVTAADFVQYMYDNGRRNYLFADDEFNFEDAMKVESAEFLYDNDIL